MNSITYKLCKNKVVKGMYETREEMQTMLDVFYAGNRITTEQYQELSTLLDNKEAEKVAVTQ